MPIVVKNNKPAYHSICLVMQMATEESPSKIEMLCLDPGSNVIQDKQYAVLEKTPAFIEKRARGIYTVVEKDVKDSDKSNVKDSDITNLDSLNGYSNEKAIEIVKETYHLDTLRNWESDENPKNKKRSKILKAIKEQIESLTKKEEE